MLYFEFQLLRNLDHPHILRIYDLYKDQRYIYMITELCEGGDIFSMIQKADNFNEKIASRIMKQVMNAVLYCHSNGIVHRDIKSDNILFLENNIDSPIKLIDFGISLKFEKNTKLKDKTGTVLYIAPEVLQGSYDEKCDIWSCGVLMYMMLSGVPPFYGATRKEVMQKISKGKFSFKSKVWSIISKEAKELIEKMLTLNPEKRPSAREVLNHPWFIKDQSVKINTAQYLENMSRYEVEKCFIKNQSQLVQAIMTFIMTNVVTHDETKELQNLFAKLDTDKDGKLSQQELYSGRQISDSGFKQVYPHLDDDAINEQVANIIRNADGNHSGLVDYTEYLIISMQKEKLLSKDKLTKAFNAFDLVDLFSCRTATGSFPKKNGKNASETNNFQITTGRCSLKMLTQTRMEIFR